MNIFIVTSHPEERSFNFALRNTAVSKLKLDGHGVTVSDLVQEGFDPVAGRGDFSDHPLDRRLDLAKAQNAASSTEGFVAEISREQKRLSACDLLILQFPIWWGSYPAILKGWIERVLAYGFAYGREHTLAAKAVMFSVTTGGAESDTEVREYEHRVSALSGDVFGYMGWRILPAFLAHGVGSLERADRERVLRDYKDHLESVLGSGAPL